MDERNGDCFDHHDDLFTPLSVSDAEHDCLKEFLLESPHASSVSGPPLPSIHSVPPLQQVVSPWNNGQMLPFSTCGVDVEPPSCMVLPPINHHSTFPPTTGDTYPAPVAGESYHPATGETYTPTTGNSFTPVSGDSFPPTSGNSYVPTSGTSFPPPVTESFPSATCESYPPPSTTTTTSGETYSSTTPSTGTYDAHLRTNSFTPSSSSASDLNPFTPSSEVDQSVPVTNGDCWSPATFTASASERTVSSDCVSSETMCSPSEGPIDSPSPSKPLAPTTAAIEEPPKKVERRGRKRKNGSKGTTTVTTYQSQISPDQNGIKIRIKKSMTEVPQRAKKKKQKDEVNEYVEPTEQTAWGDRIPTLVLHKIFGMVTRTEGCVPFLLRVSRVCKLWREVAISPDLWHHVNLAKFWVKDRAKNDLKFRWLCENRLALVHDLHIGGWEFDGIPGILDKMASSCGELRGLSLNGWQGLSAEHLKFLISHCPKLQRLDLSAINSEMGNPKSAVAMTSLVALAQEMNERLTQLVLSDNKLSGIPQIITALATHCPNLQVLDLSNVRTVSHTTVPVHIEKLQQGCPNLRALRLTNSEVYLAPVSFKEQSLSEGFPQLEELSVAGVVENMSAKPVIDDDALLRILKNSHKLRLLDVRGCTRVTDSSLVRVPAWDLEHLFLSGCYVTRINDSGLELICQKWAHSLVEVDLAWSTATEPLDAAVNALAGHAVKSPLRVLNLCGSSVTVEPVKAVLRQCSLLTSLNLTSCRGMPRGIKRLYCGSSLNQLRETILKEQIDTDD